MLIKHKIIKHCILLTLIAIFFCVVLSVEAKATGASDRDRIIVSLGDSYSSGEGIEPFFGQDKELSEKAGNEDWLAHRSQNAWSGMLTLPGVNGTMADNHNTHWFFTAASGAKIKHLQNEQKKTYNKAGSITGHWTSNSSVSGTEYLPAQLDVFDKPENRKADYVTLTLGGNDADFAGIITDVVLGSTYLNLSGLSNKLNSTWEDFYEEGGIGDKLSASYEDIAASAGSQAQIIVAGYPQLLDSSGKGFFVSEEEATLVNTAVSNFNEAIEQIVNECQGKGMNICFVSVEEAFEGHGAYSDDPYINEVIFGTKSEDLKDMDVTSAYSIHPNYAGACAYAKCVQEKIDELEQKQLFDETCWMWSKGVTAGSLYAVLFHPDGTLNYYKMNEELLGSATYEYKNSTLYIDNIAYVWQDDQFVSTENFEVNGSMMPEDFNLYPDEEGRYHQFVPSYSIENFSTEIQEKYGTASCTEFISCISGSLRTYPGTISGFLTESSVDLDFDGKDERLVFLSDAEDQSVCMQVYLESVNKYILSCQETIAQLNYCDQQNFSLFYSEAEDSYLLFRDSRTSYALTGVSGQSGFLWYVNPTQIALCDSISRNTMTASDVSTEDISAFLLEYDVPYAQNCTQIDHITKQSKYTELLEITHIYFNVDPLNGWYTQEHHLQLLTPQNRNKPMDIVQTWTITVQSSQGFTEYREETWTETFISGKTYTILPTWEDGEETTYSILDYQVDTQERTIVIFMDLPESAEHWGGLTLDLKNNTYHRVDYTEN